MSQYLISSDAAQALRQNTAARGREALQSIALKALTTTRYDNSIDDRLTLAGDAYNVGWEAAIARMLAPLSEYDAGDLGWEHAIAALESAGVQTDSREWFISLFAFRFMIGYQECCK